MACARATRRRVRGDGVGDGDPCPLSEGYRSGTRRGKGHRGGGKGRPRRAWGPRAPAAFPLRSAVSASLRPRTRFRAAGLGGARDLSAQRAAQQTLHGGFGSRWNRAVLYNGSRGQDIAQEVGVGRDPCAASTRGRSC